MADTTAAGVRLCALGLRCGLCEACGTVDGRARLLAAVEARGGVEVYAAAIGPRQRVGTALAALIGVACAEHPADTKNPPSGRCGGLE
jgi:hypothetical protein